jgi:hypothetical protein
MTLEAIEVARKTTITNKIQIKKIPTYATDKRTRKKQPVRHQAFNRSTKYLFKYMGTLGKKCFIFS